MTLAADVLSSVVVRTSNLMDQGTSLAYQGIKGIVIGTLGLTIVTTIVALTPVVSFLVSAISTVTLPIFALKTLISWANCREFDKDAKILKLLPSNNYHKEDLNNNLNSLKRSAIGSIPIVNMICLFIK